MSTLEAIAMRTFDPVVSSLATDDAVCARMDALMHRTGDVGDAEDAEDAEDAGDAGDAGDAVLIIVDCQKGLIAPSAINAAARSIALGRRSEALGYSTVVATRLAPNAESAPERLVGSLLDHAHGGELASGVADVANSLMTHGGWSSATHELLGMLKEKYPARIDVCGVGTEHGVLTTALDLANEGLPVRVLARYCGSYRSRGGNRRALALMETLLGGESVYRGWVE